MDDICRLCLGSGANNDIFQNGGLLTSRIAICCRLQPQINDRLPTVICMSCRRNLDHIWNFQTLCHESDKKLRASLSPIVDSLRLSFEVPIKIERPSPERESKHSSDENDYTSDNNPENNDIDIEDIKIEEVCVFEPEQTMNTFDKPIKIHIPKKTLAKYAKKRSDSIVDDLNSNKKACTVCHKYIAACGMSKHLKSHQSDSKAADKPKHKIDKSKEFKYECEHCKKLFKRKDRLESHKSVHFRKKAICPICGRSFTASRMTNHLKCHQNDSNKKSPEFKPNRRFKCEICHRTFFSISNLIQHLRLKHSEDDCNKLCSVCDVRVSIDELTDHMWTHQDTLVSCSRCNQKFIDGAGLADHMIATHAVEGPSGLKLPCDQCGKLIQTVKSLKRHIRDKHTKPYKRQCEICLRYLSSKPSYENHMRIHAGEKNFECDICGQKFSFKSSIQTHIMKHMNYRPYACQYCDRSFTTPSSLTEHVRLHTGEKPFMCSVCGKTFAQRGNMKSHMRYNHK